ncbi:MAG: hypothetical protein IJ689_00600 [Alphaproteobacteria bacterium]|nr:hypothetical protein [Alphaproteobacteria bacterium]
MIEILVWGQAIAFAILIVVCALPSFMPQERAEDRHVRAFIRPITESEVPLLRQWFEGLISGRAMSEKDRMEVRESLKKLRQGKSFACIARWMLSLLEHCPSADCRIVFERLKNAHVSLAERYYNYTARTCADAVSYKGCDNLIYAMRLKYQWA